MLLICVSLHTVLCAIVETVLCIAVKWEQVRLLRSAAVELVVSNDRSLFVHSLRRILLGESVGCVIVGSERGAEYTESRV